MWFLLNINPEPWKVGPVVVGRRGGKVYGNIGRDQQLHAYQDAVREALEEQLKQKLLDYPPGTNKYCLEIFFWRQRAEYETPQARTHRKHEADLTNMMKATEDACQGLLFDNDRDVIESHLYLMEQSTTSPGRVVIHVTEADTAQKAAAQKIPMGIWKMIAESYILDAEVEPAENWQPETDVF